jgi:DnaK suppressor protein
MSDKKVLKKKTKKRVKKKGTKPAAKKTPKKTKPKAIKKRKSIVKILELKKPISKKSEEERKNALRKLLINRREEIIKEAKSEISKYIKGETRQLVDTALDDGDWSVIDLSEDISLKQLSTHRENLLKIDEALRKLDEGTYGICEDCGGEISEERLQVIPLADGENGKNGKIDRVKLIYRLLKYLHCKVLDPNIALFVNY